MAALGELAGLPGGAGVLTTGGTGSTYTALLLARDGAATPVRLYASAVAHFSVERSAHLLGLPPVVAVPVDRDQRMDVGALAALLSAAPSDERPVVVATAKACRSSRAQGHAACPSPTHSAPRSGGCRSGRC